MKYPIEWFIEDEKYNIYTNDLNLVAKCEQEEIATRITSCVNACVHFSNEQLKAGNVMDIIGALIIKIEDAKQEINTWKERYEFSASERKKLLKLSNDAKRYDFLKNGNAVIAHNIFTNVDEEEWDRYIDDAISQAK